MTIRSLPSLTVSFLILGLLPAFADTQIIPQVADGAGWSTTIVLVNKTSSTQSVTLSFNMDTANSATTPWTPPFVESVSLSSISLPAGSTLFLHTPGTAATLTQGWGQLDAAAGVAGYAIFTQRVAGLPAQDGTAPAVSASSRILVPFDNTSGLVSAFAMANPNSAAEIVQVNIRTSDGTLSGTLPILPAKGQTTFLIAQLFSATAGKSGLAEFYVASGSISIIALRANGSAFTAAPVYAQSGSPIIGAPNNVQNSSSQTQVIPQVADGAGWATTIVLTNTTTGDLPFTLNFKQAIPNGAGVTTAWNPPFQDTSALGSNIPAGSSIFLRTPGNATDLSQGWAELVADPRVTGYAIFTSRQGGGRAQDSTAPAVSASSRILVPFDNSSNLIMALALVNPNASAETVSVNFRTSDGTTTTATVVPTLPLQGQITFLLPTLFAQTAGKSGLAEFYVSSGTISIIALRANGTAITSAPVSFETGTPIITTGGGGGGGGGGAGNIVAGGFFVAKTTVTLTGSGIPTSTSESIGGNFSSYTQAEWQYPFSAPTFGACSVLDITDPAKPPYLPDAYLDAGTITVSGPNLPSGTAVPKNNLQMGPSYILIDTTGTKLADGGTYTISGSGGSQVGPFTASATLPQSFTVTNWDAITAINRANGLTVNWSGTGFNTVVITATGQTLATGETMTASCVVAGSLGTFSIPQGALAMLFPTQLATLTVTASTVNPGTPTQLRTTLQTLVPSLVGGGQVNYGDIGGQVSVLKSLSIQ
jgi:hypothetical protein